MSDVRELERKALEKFNRTFDALSQHDRFCPDAGKHMALSNAVYAALDAYGRAVREADKEAMCPALEELRVMVSNTSSWNHVGFRRIWTAKIDAAAAAIEALEVLK